MQRFLEDREPTLVSRLLNDPSLSDELLINFLCYALDFSPMEKQALLEAPGLAERGARLCDVVQFALEARHARRRAATSGTTDGSRPARLIGHAGPR